MLEEDIIQHISKQLSVVGSTFFFLKFSFLKVVDDLLIKPDIESWDYSTVKHIAGQGPIYIRVHKKLKAKGDLLHDDYDYKDNEIHFPSVAPYKKESSVKSTSNTENTSMFEEKKILQ